jgi:hypothetical protein
MSIKIICECGGKFKINMDQMGKRVKCPSCGQMLMAFQPGDLEGIPESEPAHAMEGKEIDSAEMPPVAPSTAKAPGKNSRKTLVWGGVGALVVATGIGCYLLIVNPFGREAAPDSKNTVGPSPPSARSTGFLGFVNFAQVAGWAWDPAQPDTPIGVDIYDNDSLLITVPADKFRNDLAKFAGNGKHGFHYAIPPEIRDGKEHVIRAKITGTQIELKNSPKKVTLKPKESR